MRVCWCLVVRFYKGLPELIYGVVFQVNGRPCVAAMCFVHGPFTVASIDSKTLSSRSHLSPERS